MKRSGLIFIFFASFYSCHQSVPYGIINKNAMREILWDLVKADATAQEFVLKDSTKKISVETVRLTKEVFLIHKISQDGFDKSYSYYTHHPDILSAMFDSINVQQNRKHNLMISKPFPTHPSPK